MIEKHRSFLENAHHQHKKYRRIRLATSKISTEVKGRSHDKLQNHSNKRNQSESRH